VVLEALLPLFLTYLLFPSQAAIIDRLENVGYVRRTNDPKDRRRTIVELTRNRKLERKIEVIFMHLHERMHKLMSSYSDNELAFLLDATTAFIEQTHEESKNLRHGQK
jgi:DNA-binding MarR family transcriptional regulator